MGFSLSGALSGLAKGGSAILDANKKEEDEQRKKVEDSIFSTTNVMFQNAQLAQTARTKESKDNKKYLNTLISQADSLANDPAKQAFVLSLSDEAKKDLLKLTVSPTFINANKPLTDYFEAIDDPIEFKDPVTLVERVQGKVVDRPLSASEYYGVSTTNDEEVDTLLESYGDQLSVAYNMSPERAQGLLDVAKQEVKVQRFSINWANKKFQSATADATNVQKLTNVRLTAEASNQNLAVVFDNYDTKIQNEGLLTWAADNGIPLQTLKTDPSHKVNYEKSEEFAKSRHKIIQQAARDMIEAPDRILDRSTNIFFKKNYPGYWGGNANNVPFDKLINGAYYEIKSAGKVEILRGKKIKELMEGPQQPKKGAVAETKDILSASESSVISEDQSLLQANQINVSKSDVISIRNIDEEIIYQTKRIAEMKKTNENPEVLMAAEQELVDLESKKKQIIKDLRAERDDAKALDIENKVGKTTPVDLGGLTKRFNAIKNNDNATKDEIRLVIAEINAAIEASQGRGKTMFDNFKAQLTARLVKK